MMTVVIGGKKYRVSESAMSALRYRTLYGKSCLSRDFTNADMLNLLYASIVGEKPSYTELEKLAKKEPLIYGMAYILYREVTRSDSKGGSIKFESTENDNEFDEFHIMAVFSQTGLPQFLWEELRLAQIVSLVGLTFEVKSGDAKPKEINYSEAAELYQIDQSESERIQEYLRTHEDGG